MSPESLFERLLGLLQGFVGLESVEMRHDADYFGKPVQLQLVEELEGLHLEPVRGVGQQQHQVCDFRKIGHRVQVRGTLEQRDAALSAGHTRDGSSSGREVLSLTRPSVIQSEWF